MVAACAFLLPTAGCTASGPAASEQATGRPQVRAQPRVLAGPLAGRTGARLRVGDAASTVTVRLADLPGLLYRVATPAGGGLSAAVTGRNGRVDVRLRTSGDSGPDAVIVLLNRAVCWDVRLPAGAGEVHLDLRRGRLARVDVGVAGLVEIGLPRPRGIVPITLTDAVGSVRVTAPKGTPVRRVRGPATGADGYVIIARGDVGDLTLDN